MKRFKNILVGVDLSTAERLVGEDISLTTRSALARGLELATHNSARVTLATSLDISERARYLIDHTDDENGGGFMGQVHEILTKLEQPFRDAGLEVDHQVSIGRGWLELIYCVLRNKHDLVIIGARGASAVERFFLGSTGIRLMRNCPCPVWVVHRHDEYKIDSVLIANDLSPISNQAMELGCSMADAHDAELHVLSVLEQPGEDASLATVVATKSDHDNFREIAEQEIQAQLNRIEPKQSPHLHILEGVADSVIVEQLDKLRVDLLVMGTISRTGIQGLLTGNTAERLLPRIACSVLAIKPDDFVCPIQVA